MAARNIKLSGAEFEPRNPTWDSATPAERRRYWTALADIALRVKRKEIVAGIGVDGNRLEPVQRRSRPDGAKGKPLDPHYAESRTYRLLAAVATADGATLFWRGAGRQSWATILGYHADGVVIGAPLRDVIGLSPAGRKQVRAQAETFWGTIKPAPKPLRFAKSEAGAFHGDVAVRVDLRKLDRDLRLDQGAYVGRQGNGAAKPGSYRLAVAAVASGQVAMPRLALDARGRAVVRDGRHRLAALRDAGAATVWVSVPRGEAKRFKDRYGPEGG